MRCCELLYVTTDGGSRPRARSGSLAIDKTFWSLNSLTDDGKLVKRPFHIFRQALTIVQLWKTTPPYHNQHSTSNHTPPHPHINQHHPTHNQRTSTHTPLYSHIILTHFKHRSTTFCGKKGRINPPSCLRIHLYKYDQLHINEGL